MIVTVCLLECSEDHAHNIQEYILSPVWEKADSNGTRYRT